MAEPDSGSALTPVLKAVPQEHEPTPPAAGAASDTHHDDDEGVLPWLPGSASSSSPLQASPGLATSMGLGCLFYAVLIAVGVALHVLRVRLGLFSALLIQFAFAWPLVLWLGLRGSRASWREAFPLTRFPVRILPALLLASVGASILLAALTALIPVSGQFGRAVSQGVERSNTLSLFLAAVVVAPVAEELFFRGLVLRAYVARYSVFHAVWMSALFFALFHLNLRQAVLAVPLGLAYAWLTLRTGSIIPGMLSHAVFNFTFNFLLLPLAGVVGYDAAEAARLEHMPVTMLLLGGVLTAVGGCRLWQQRASMSGAPGTPEKESTEAPHELITGLALPSDFSDPAGATPSASSSPDP